MEIAATCIITFIIVIVSIMFGYGLGIARYKNEDEE